MRHLSAAAAVAAAALVLSPAAYAQDRAQVGAFGGFTFGDTASASTFGGSFSTPLAGNLHIVAEGGRLDNVVPSNLETLLDFTPVDLRVSAWYGEAGVRFLASPHSKISPYVDATAGFARMQTGFAGAGDADPIVNAALRFLDTTEPLLGAGGGVIVRGGPLTLDLGYRYKKIFAADSFRSVLTGGDINLSQARIGIGISF